jgi:hypothetical protein
MRPRRNTGIRTTDVYTGTESCTVTVGGRVGTTVTGTVGTVNAVLIGMEAGWAAALVAHWQRQRQVGTTKNEFIWWHMINR